MITTNDVIEGYKKGEKFEGIAAHNSDFTGLNLHDIILKNCDLSFSGFAGADLTGADLSGCNLTGCNFSGAILRNTDFHNSTLSRANISKALIENTNFRGANFMFAHLCGNDLMKADLSGAALDWSCLIDTKLTDQQLSGIPKDAIVSGNAPPGDYKLREIGGYASPKGSGYSSPLGGPGPGYSGPGSSEAYTEPHSVTKEIHPVFQKKKQPDHKEY